MDIVEQNSLQVNYELAQKQYWTGRETDPNLGKQYWHQAISIANLQDDFASLIQAKVGLLGYACDEGVRRNLGRTGAKDGPNAVRQQLARLPFHHESKVVVDFGNLLCADMGMEDCQASLSVAVSQLLRQAIFPIVIGGGHDMAYGHFKGIRKAIEHSTKNKIGIINFDAHFDLRPIEQKANSGTPFLQILEAYGDEVEYFAIGIQQQSNTKSLYEIAKKHQVNFLTNYECELANFEHILSQINPFLKRNDYIYITIDMDGFSSAYAPGVSAPSPLGFTPYFLLKFLAYLFQSKKVIALDIAEVNPSYDRDQLTANLAARIVDHVLNLV